VCEDEERWGEGDQEEEEITAAGDSLRRKVYDGGRRVKNLQSQDEEQCGGRRHLHSEQWRSHQEPKMVLQSDAIEEPFLVPQRTFQTRVL